MEWTSLARSLSSGEKTITERLGGILELPQRGALPQVRASERKLTRLVKWNYC